MLERLSFYLGSCLSASLEIEKELDSNRLIVLDRYFYSTIAYHQAKLGYIPKAINNILPFLQKPDLILYIKTNFQLTIERLNLRGLSMNDKLFLNEEHYDKIHLNYLNSFNVKYFIVDNFKNKGENKIGNTKTPMTKQDAGRIQSAEDKKEAIKKDEEFKKSA